MGPFLVGIRPVRWIRPRCGWVVGATGAFIEM